MIQWLFIFYFYCFFGWCFESAYVSLCKRKFVNRGFMRGPFLPLYGSGAVMMLLVSSPFYEHWWAVYIAGCIGATILEYFTGVIMEAIFKVRYWDYSKQHLQFQGHICLSSSLAWGGLTLLMVYVIHEPIEGLIFKIPSELLTVSTILLTFYIAWDFALSFKAALDLRDVLQKLAKVKEEMAGVQKRLEKLAEELGKKKEAFAGKHWLEEFKESIEKNIAAELMELHTKYRLNVDFLEKVKKHRGLYKRIFNNPTMSSKKYKEALEELKKDGTKEDAEKDTDK